MKKFLHMLFTVCLIISMGSAVFASNIGGTVYTDMPTIDINVNYTAVNTGTTSPAEKMQFTITKDDVRNAADGVTKDNMPMPEISEVSFSEGAAGSADNSIAKLSVKLPEIAAGDKNETNVFRGVGVYGYKISPTAGATAGVTYHVDDIRLVVTVIEGENGELRIAAVHTEKENGKKSDSITETYSAGSLAVKKEVAGNMGEQDKKFNVTVTFTAPEGKTVNSTITYVEGAANKEIVPADSTGSDSAGKWDAASRTASVTIQLKHDEEITFKNIPYGVTWKVEEENYTTKDKGEYDAAVYKIGDETTGNKGKNIPEGSIKAASETVTIINKKGMEVDTGVGLDSLPYIFLMAFVGVGLVVMFVRKSVFRKR